MDGRDIIFTAPSRDGRKLLNNTATASDVIASVNNGSLDKDDIFTVKKYSPVGVFNVFQDEEFVNAPKEEQIESVNFLKTEYPEQAKEIEMLYNNTLKEIIEHREQDLKEYSQEGMRRFFPESMFKDAELEKFKTL
jgi:hypothetical protein